LGWVVKLDKGEFIGRAELERVKREGVKRKLIGFKLLDKGIPRQDYELFSFDNKVIGKVTSGTLSPTLKESIGIGYVSASFAAEGQEIFVNIRGRMAKAVVVKTPFVKK
jgi:aminomethyltransferase